MDFKNLLTVLKFTIKESVKRLSFIVTTIIFIILIIAAFNIPNILSAVGVNETTFSSKVQIVDSKNIYEGSLDILETDTLDMGYEFVVTNEELNIDEAKNIINNEDITEVLIINQENGELKIDYVVKNLGYITSPPETLTNMLNQIYKDLQISKLGLTNEQIQSLTPVVSFNMHQAEETEIGANMGILMMISAILFMGIYMFAYQVSMSITTEKTSKIMETLVTSTSPATIVLGKTIGTGIVGLSQILLYIIVAVISANLFLEPGMLEQVLDLENITVLAIAVTLVYFVLGYFMYAFMYALTGSTVSKPEDVQSANGPVAVLAVAGFYLGYFTIMSPTSSLNYFASLFPLSSPFTMPIRILLGLASGTDIIISILILVITMAIVSKIAIRIYSNAILNNGNNLNLKNIFKLYKQK